MSKNLIKIPKQAEIQDEFAIKADKRKAYQIFLLSALSAIGLTAIMYFIDTLFIGFTSP